MKAHEASKRIAIRVVDQLLHNEEVAMVLNNAIANSNLNAAAGIVKNVVEAAVLGVLTGDVNVESALAVLPVE